MDHQPTITKKVRKTENPEYFNLYYHENNEYVICTCGQSIRRFYMHKHIKIKKHSFLLAKKAEKEQILIIV